MAPREVTTQSGRGSGPRQSGSTSDQVVQRWRSSSGSSYDGSRRRTGVDPGERVGWRYGSGSRTRLSEVLLACS